MLPIRWVSLGYQQITSTGTAVGLTVPGGASMAMLGPETQAVRFRDDGTAPSATVGMLLPTGVSPFCYTGNLANIQIIAAVGGAILNVSYYRSPGFG